MSCQQYSAGLHKVTYIVALVGALSSLQSSMAADREEVTDEKKAESVVKQDATSVDIKQLVAQLGEAEFELRREAFLKLWREGSRATDLVAEAKSSSNVQVAQAAMALETLLRLGGQTTDPDVLKWILKPSPEGIIRLCSKGYWQLALQSLGVLQTDEATRAKLRGASGSLLVDRMVEQALAQNDPALAWPLVEKINETDGDTYDGSNLVVWISSKLGLPLSDRDSIADRDSLEKYYEGEQVDVLAQELTPALRRKLVTRGARWEQLSDPDVQDLILEGRQGLARRAAKAVLLEFAGDLEASDAIWAELLPNKTDDDEEVDLSGEELAEYRLLNDVPGFNKNQVLLALLASGRPAAIQYELESNADRYPVFNYYTGLSEYEKVFKIIGLKTDLSNFEEWILLQKSKLANSSRSTDARVNYGIAARSVNLLVGLGFRSQAERLLDASLDAAGRNRTPVREFTRWMTRGEPRAMLLRALESRFRSQTTESNSTAWGVLFPEMQQSTSLLIKSMPRELLTRPEGTPGVLESLDHLYSWDEEFFAQFDTSIYAWLSSAQNRIALERNGRTGVSGYQLQELSKLAKGCGYEELALEFALEQPASGGTVFANAQTAAEILLERGDAEQAASILSSARAASTYYVTSQSALLLETQALLLSGQYEKAIQLDTSRWLRALSVSRSNLSYSQVFDEFFEKSDYELAEQFGNVAFQMSDFASTDLFWSAYDLSRSYEETELLSKSADVLRASIVEGFTPNSPLLDYQVQSGQVYILRNTVKRERIHRAATSIEAGDFEAAQRHIAVGGRLHPQDIEMVVACYPRLVKAGEQEIADSLFDIYEGRLLTQIEKWPNDAMALNNLAWMYSQCDRKLEEAYELASHGVELAPASAVYLDTLAEVHFRAGRIKEAIETMEKCVRMDPREQHYRQNLVRFAAKL